MMGCVAYEESASTDISCLDHPPGVQAASLPFGTRALWEKNRLRVHFINEVPFSLEWRIDGDQITRQSILDLANVWRDETCCDSVPKFEWADSKEQSDIRVKFYSKSLSHICIHMLLICNMYMYVWISVSS